MVNFTIIHVLLVFVACICKTYSQVTVEHTTVNGTNGDATIKCTVADGTGLQGHFEYNGVRVADDGDRKKTTFEGGVLSLDIKAVDYVTEIGEYKCIFNEGETFKYDAVVYLNAIPHVNKFDTSKNLVEGDKLVLNCDAYGYPTVMATWFNDDVMVETDSRVSFSDYKLGEDEKDPMVSNGTLVIKNVVFADAGYYSCNATNDFGVASKGITIRVKSKYAALWPFLGICAEVIVLCLIIFIYERRRAAKLAKEDAKEEENDKLNANSGDVRQRKT